MKTIAYFIFTSMISAFAGFGALGTKDPEVCVTCLTVALGIWLLFFLSWNRRIKKEANKRYMEHEFRNFMRNHRY